MRIIVDNGEYGVVNRGDMAMMTVTLRRLRHRWPGAELGVLTSAPARLGLFFPDALPIVPARGGAWPATRTRAFLPPPALRATLRAERLLSRAASPLQRVRARLRPIGEGGEGGAAAGAGGWPPAAVWSSDLLVCAGGGYLTDVDPEQVDRTLSLLAAAHSVGIPTALLGQGIGPLDEPRLVEAAERALPHVRLIAVREALVGPKRLAELGVDPTRIVVTGDDAVEFAHGLRRPGLGSGLGVNLRVVDYTGIDPREAAWVREAIHSAAFTLRAPLTPVHVSEWDDEDRLGTATLTEGYPEIVADRGREAAPDDAIRRVGACRVMVTGTYHAAVFALSQGVPAVCMTRSRYYDDKFHGLADQFPGGCSIIELDGPAGESRLRRAILRAWDAAPTVRPGLLEHAARQIATGLAAHDEIAGVRMGAGDSVAA